MCMIRFSHLLAIAPIALILTLSFFVLLALRKVEEKGFKAFGYVVASLLWLAALVVFSSAIFKMGKELAGVKCMMREKMKAARISQMMQDNMPAKVMAEKCAPAKGQRGAISARRSSNKGFIFKTE